jgi:hypothetical protein
VAITALSLGCASRSSEDANAQESNVTGANTTPSGVGEPTSLTVSINGANTEVATLGPFAASGRARGSAGNVFGNPLILHAGTTLALRVDDGGPRSGSPAVLSHVIALAAVDGGPPASRRFDVEAVDRPGYDERTAFGEISAPAAAKDKIELTLELHYANGQVRTVMDGNKPFLVDVIANDVAGTVSFGGSLGAPSLTGRAVQGKTLRIAYDMARIDTLRKAEAGRQGQDDLRCYGHPYTGSKPFTPGVEANFAFRDAAGAEIVTLATRGDMKAPAVDVKVPAGAARVEMWFSSVCYVQGASGERWRVWDSNYAKNFAFPISP